MGETSEKRRDFLRVNCEYDNTRETRQSDSVFQQRNLAIARPFVEGQKKDDEKEEGGRVKRTKRGMVVPTENTPFFVVRQPDEWGIKWNKRHTVFCEEIFRITLADMSRQYLVEAYWHIIRESDPALSMIYGGYSADTLEGEKDEPGDMM
ncbi:hypothetical protein PV325_004680 [Microctonus aethiopoides]|nr:hypothetical protein PV325_004680 [Microctonus aethiopoides]